MGTGGELAAEAPGGRALERERPPIHPLRQLLRYSVSGSVATAVHTILFYFFAWKLLPALGESDRVVTLLGLPVEPVTDAVRAAHYRWNNAAAFAISNFTAYLLNKAWVFPPGRRHPVVEISLFYLVSGISILIGVLVTSLSIEHLGSSTTAAMAVNLVLSMLINFTLRKYVVFRR